MSDKNTTIEELKDKIAVFRDERGWNKYHTPRSLSISISLEAGELLEHFQWEDEDHAVDSLKNNPEKFNEIKKELSDVLIYSLNLANTLGIDVAESVISKLAAAAKKYPIKHFNPDKQDHEYYKKIKSQYRSGKTSA